MAFAQVLSMSSLYRESTDSLTIAAHDMQQMAHKWYYHVAC